MDRRYVSKYSMPTFGLKVLIAGSPQDADAAPEVEIRDAEGQPTSTGTATRTGPGSYEYRLSSTQTAEEGFGTIIWRYRISGVDQIFGSDFEVGPSAPEYDALPVGWQDIIERVWVKFADLFDSPFGGPNLQVYVQTKFGRNRLAQLLVEALQTLNTASSPHQSYEYGGSFPFAEWGGLLSQSLYIEVLEHLVRSYVEQPEAILGTAVSRLDRRDYMNRWQEILNGTKDKFRSDLDKYRMANLGLGSVSVLVSGGVYGNMGPTFDGVGMGVAAARGYFGVVRH